MLRLILGTAGSGKTTLITNEISAKIAAGERGVYMLVPEQYSHEAERQLAAVCGDKLSLGAEVLSFSRLASRVAQETGTGGKTHIDAGGRLLCMCLAIKQIGTRLRTFTGAERSAKLQHEILKAVDELKNANVSPEALYLAAENSGGKLALKLTDLALCLEAYNAVLAQGHADPADKLHRLAETITDSAVAKHGTIYIDGFTDFTGAQSRVIEALIFAGTPVTICLTCDELFSDAEHFHHARIAANALLRFAGEQGVETEVTTSNAPTGKAEALAFYNDHLFKYTSETVADAHNTVTAFRAADRRAECELAAARALELVRETNCRRRDIAVAARGFDGYAAQLTEAFRLYGVPLFAAKRGNIMQKPLPALLDTAFAVLTGGWDLPDVLAYMKTGLTGLSPADCDKLESYAALWSISGSAWRRDKAWTQHPRGFGFETTDAGTALLDEINAIRRALAAPLLRLAEAGKRAETAAAQAQALLAFLLDITLPETLEAHAHDLENADLTQLADEFSQLWATLCRALEQFTALLGDTPMQQAEFFELFLKTLSQYDVSTIPFSPDAVTAGEIDRMRRRSIKHLIILGVSDDALPGATAPGGLFSEDEREFLETAGLGRAGETARLAREYSLIYNCITLPSDTLTLTYCVTDADGSRARPAFPITRAEMLLGTQIQDVDLDKLRLTAPESAWLLASRAGGSPASALAQEYFAATEAARLENLKTRAAFTRSDISGECAEALYGKTLRISPSRADAYFSCKFYYFLRYGLKLNEKEKAGFNPPELGTYMHYVLEKSAAEISRTVGFKNAATDLAEELTDRFTDQYIAEALGGFADKSPRFIFLFNRLRPSVKRVVADMVRELSRSDFAPLGFELSFAPGGDAPPIHLTNGESELYINGTIDRVDGCYLDGKLYLRVVDYKTGKKSFSLSDVWYGMGMQMLLYLFSLERSGIWDAEIVPAGVLYVPARDAIISAKGDLTDEELAAQKAKNLKRSGLILNDPAVINAMEHGEQPEYIPVKYKNGELQITDTLADKSHLAALRNHVDRRLLEVSRGISGGQIAAEPCWKSGSDNACNFCPYDRVCRFDESAGTRRYLGKIAANDFWSILGGAENG